MKFFIASFLALLLTGLVIWLAADLPVARIYVGVVLVACFLVQLRFPEAWLLYIPALLPIFDLTLWSGRLYIDEFDLLVLTTASAHLWHASVAREWQFPSVASKGGAVILFVFASFMLSMVIGALPLSYPDATQLSNYLSHYNALRVGKSAVWGLLLLAPLQWSLARNAARAEALFIVGTSLGLILVGLVVLWERGVFLTIAQSHGLYAGRWAILGALLDFTASYRATALFSELHTGGEAMDGYLALATPIAAAGALGSRKIFPRSLCFAGLGLGTYAIMAGYSRSLYAAYGGALAVVLVLSLIRGGRSGLAGKYAIWRVLAALALSEGALFIAYDHGGWSGLIDGVAIAAFALTATVILGPGSRSRAGVALGVVFAGGCYVLYRAFLASRYNVVDPSIAGAWSAVCGAALVVSALPIGGKTVSAGHRATAAVMFGVFVVVNLISIPASSGTRMFDRLLTTSEDAETRWDHWLEAARLIGPEWTDYVFGMGLGSFPRIYFRRGISPESKPSFRYESDGAHSWLDLGVGDFNITQKIPLKPDTAYRLQVATRAHDLGARMSLKLCPKLILYSDRYTPGCPVFDIRSQPLDTWVVHRFTFNSGSLGSEGFLGWPITMLLHNDADQTAIDVTDIELSDAKSNIVANGDFAAGSDRWLLISDFEHLGWHIKNLYLEIFFESGALGLAIFLFAAALALAAAVKNARRMVIGTALAGSLAGFLLVGTFGSLFDNPRPSVLFFLVLFWTLESTKPSRIVARAEGGEISSSQQ